MSNISSAGLTGFSFGSDAETYGLLPVYAGFGVGGVGLAANSIGGTNFAGSVQNGSGSFTTFFTLVALSGNFSGLINDVNFTYVNGATANVCGTTSTSAVGPGAVVGYSGSFLRPVTSIGRVAMEWDEYGITPAAQSFGIPGGAGTVFVVGNCAWSAVSHVPWIQITSAATGSGDYALTYAVAPNSGGTRSGTMTIAGHTFTVTQAGNIVCTYGVNFPANPAPSGGAAGTASVTAPAGCAWTAASSVPWLTITSGATGNGNGTVNMTVAPNVSFIPRTGQVTIAGQTFTVVQNGRSRGLTDFDGDGAADVGVFRPSSGAWFILGSTTSATYFWGGSGDVPAPGDYDGDGKADAAVFRAASGTWYIRQSSTLTMRTVGWGASGDIPVAGDYDGDGRTDIGIFRPSTGAWYILGSTTSQTYIWGGGTDIPAPGDYDGDGVTDAAVFRPSNSTWYIRQSSTLTMRTEAWGGPGDLPVSGDYDGDGKTDVAIFRPSTGAWYVLGSTASATYVWGGGDDVPVPADYDGDGQVDAAIFRPAASTWYIRQSSTLTMRTVTWGGLGDIPVAGGLQVEGRSVLE
jgi:hypothetical protein